MTMKKTSETRLPPPVGRMHYICGKGDHDHCPGRCLEGPKHQRVPCTCSCHRHDKPHPKWKDGEGARKRPFWT